QVFLLERGDRLRDIIIDRRGGPGSIGQRSALIVNGPGLGDGKRRLRTDRDRDGADDQSQADDQRMKGLRRGKQKRQKGQKGQKELFAFFAPFCPFCFSHSSACIGQKIFFSAVVHIHPSLLWPIHSTGRGIGIVGGQ